MANERDPERDQQLPVPHGMDVQAMMIAAIKERRQHGVRKYGQPLRSEDGRDTLRDLYEELLDAWSYAAKLLIQRDGTLPFVNAADEPRPTVAGLVRPPVGEHDAEFNDLQDYLEGDRATAQAAARRLDQRAVDTGQLSPAGFKAVHGVLPAITPEGHRCFCPGYRHHAASACTTWGQR